MGEEGEDRRQRGKGGDGGGDEGVVEDGPGCGGIWLKIGGRDAEIGMGMGLGLGLERDNDGHCGGLCCLVCTGKAEASSVPKGAV